MTILVSWLFTGLVAGCDRAGERADLVITAGDVAIPVNAAKRGADGYRPNPLVVKPGATVTWTNHDSIWHTVTSDKENLFGSDPIPAGGSFGHTFGTPGTFPYHCGIPGHNNDRGSGSGTVNGQPSAPRGIRRFVPVMSPG